MPQLITQAVLNKVVVDGKWVINPSFRVITVPSQWSDIAFSLLEAEFDEEVLDPKERLETWLLETKNGTHDFPFLWVVGYIEYQGEEYLLGTLDGNLMPLVDWALHDELFHAPLMDDGSCIFTIGRQVTATVVRQEKVRGVGTGLFHFGVDAAHRQAQAQGRHISYFVLESEERSKVFWQKLGFLWPEGTVYWQPPLEFDEATGKPLRPAVKETLMFRPAKINGSSPPTITPALLRDTIATIYTYWSMHPFREMISQKQEKLHDALRVAEKSVMRDLLNECESHLPATEGIRLISPTE
ncbi:MAG TPA: hypothetical protein VGB77_19430 [Abditibacteriaceae bacterium]|jgi:hypothetical protein